jgi:phosphoserine phosphatase
MPSPLYIFDFDDTLALTDSTVLVKKADGTEVELNSREFAKYREEPGDELDFSGFLSVPGGSLIQSTVIPR